MSAPTFEQASLLSGRQLLLVVVIGLHAFAISALMAMRIASDAPKPPHVFLPPTTITQNDQVPPPPKMPIDESALVRDPRIVLPILRPMDFPLIDSTAAPETSITSDVPAGDIGLPGSAGDVAIPATELQSRATRSPDEFYPASSQRIGEQGAAVVRVCVAPSGRLEGQPTIDRSSGSRSLDAAAVRWASEALAFTPATRNGSPVTACKGFRVNFTLR